MTLAAHYIDHLRQPRINAQPFAEALAAAGLEPLAACYRAWSAHDTVHDGITISATPPKHPATGDRWFDPCELAVMLNVGRSWLALRPTTRWQMRGFLEVSVRVPREVQLEPPFAVLDPARLVPPGDELARCTELTAGEATLYAWWFGKILPHQFDWASASEQLPAALAALDLSREWTSSTVNDEAARVVITPSTIEADPDDDPSMIRGEYSRDLAVGFRTSITHQIGLLTSITAWDLLVENVKLSALCDRSAF